MWYDYISNMEEVVERISNVLDKLPNKLENLKIENVYTRFEDENCFLTFFIPTTKKYNKIYEFGDMIVTKVVLDMKDIKFKSIRKIDETNTDRIDIHINICNDYKYNYGAEYRKIKVTGALEIEVICEELNLKI